MKRHPRIRKTIKWGGATLVVILTAMWCVSGFKNCMYAADHGWILGIARGGVTVQRLGAGVGGPRLGWTVIDNGAFTVNWVPRSSETAQSWHIHSPLWPFIVVFFAAGSLAWHFDVVASARKARITHCPKCNYDRAGLRAGSNWLECGSVAP